MLSRDILRDRPRAERRRRKRRRQRIQQITLYFCEERALRKHLDDAMLGGYTHEFEPEWDFSVMSPAFRALFFQGRHLPISPRSPYGMVSRRYPNPFPVGPIPCSDCKDAGHDSSHCDRTQPCDVDGCSCRRYRWRLPTSGTP